MTTFFDFFKLVAGRGGEEKEGRVVEGFMKGSANLFERSNENEKVSAGLNFRDVPCPYL